MDALGGLSRAVAIAKQQLKIPDGDNVALIELSREQMSPLMLLTGGASASGVVLDIVQVLSLPLCAAVSSSQAHAKLPARPYRGPQVYACVTKMACRWHPWSLHIMTSLPQHFAELPCPLQWATIEG